MIVLRSVLCLLTLTIPLTLLGQPPGKPGEAKTGLFRIPPSVSLYSALYLNDPALQKELNLKSEQKSKLEPLLMTSLRHMNDAGWDRKRRDEVEGRVTKALADVLTADQQKRLRQVILQQLVRLKTGPLTLTEDAGVVEALKLTDAQKKDLGQRKRPIEVLTDEQKKIWEGLLGKVYPERLHAGNVPQAGFVCAYGSLHPLLGLVLSVPMEEELKLTGEQLQKLATILEEWYDYFPDCNISELIEAEKRLLKECAAVLTDKQRVRYHQVLHRAQLQGLHLFIAGIGATDAILYEPLVSAWNLSDAQKAERETLFKAYLTGIQELANSDIDAKDLAGHGAKLWSKTVETINAKLTTEQKAVTAEMLGESLGQGFRGSFFRPNRPEVTRPRTPRAYLARAVLSYALSRQMPEEQKLSDDQKKSLEILAKSFVLTPAFPGEMVPVQDEATSKANAVGLARGIALILTPKQLETARQIARRQLMPPLGQYVPIEILNNDELLEPLKLTEAQKVRLYRGAILSDVLEPPQRETLMKLKEPPPVVKGPSVVTPPKTTPKDPIVVTPGHPRLDEYSISAMCGSIRTMQMRVISHYAVQNDLKLTAEQKKEIGTLAKKAMLELPKPEADRKAFREKVEKLAETYHELVAKLLSEAQNMRWKQIAIQRYDMAGRGLTGLLEIRAVQESLKLTPEQIKCVADPHRLDEIRVMQLLNDASQKLRSSLKPVPRDWTMRDIQPIMEARKQRVLSREQQTALKELVGEMLKVPGGFFPLGGPFAPQPY